MAYKFCSKCYTTLNDNEKFCPNCGQNNTSTDDNNSKNKKKKKENRGDIGITLFMIQAIGYFCTVYCEGKIETYNFAYFIGFNAFAIVGLIYILKDSTLLTKTIKKKSNIIKIIITIIIFTISMLMLNNVI